MSTALLFFTLTPAAHTRALPPNTYSNPPCPPPTVTPVLLLAIVIVDFQSLPRLLATLSPLGPTNFD